MASIAMKLPPLYIHSMQWVIANMVRLPVYGMGHQLSRYMRGSIQIGQYDLQ